MIKKEKNNNKKPKTLRHNLHTLLAVSMIDVSAIIDHLQKLMIDYKISNGPNQY